MNHSNRRDFLRASAAATLSAAVDADAFAEAANAEATSGSWDAGQLKLLLPTVSDTRILVNEPPRVSWRPVGLSQTGMV